MTAQKLKKLRIEIDYVFKMLIQIITHHKSTREKTLNNLKLAKMWLGMVLGVEWNLPGEKYNAERK